MMSHAPQEPPQTKAPVVRANRIIAVLVLLLAAFVIWQSFRLGVGVLNNPAAGSWPMLLGVVLGISGLAILLRPSAANDIDSLGTRYRKPAIGVVSIVAYGLLLPVLGFEILSLLLMVVWLRFLGGETWRSTVIGSVSIVVVLYFVFVVALAVPIPRIL